MDKVMQVVFLLNLVMVKECSDIFVRINKDAVKIPAINSSINDLIATDALRAGSLGFNQNQLLTPSSSLEKDNGVVGKLRLSANELYKDDNGLTQVNSDGREDIKKNEITQKNAVNRFVVDDSSIQVKHNHGVVKDIQEDKLLLDDATKITKSPKRGRNLNKLFNKPNQDINQRSSQNPTNLYKSNNTPFTLEKNEAPKVTSSNDLVIKNKNDIKLYDQVVQNQNTDLKQTSNFQVKEQHKLFSNQKLAKVSLSNNVQTSSDNRKLGKSSNDNENTTPPMSNQLEQPNTGNIADDNVSQQNIDGNVKNQLDTEIESQQQVDNNISIEDDNSGEIKFRSVSVVTDLEKNTELRSLKVIYEETFLIRTLNEMNKGDYLTKIKELVIRMDKYIDNFLKTITVNTPKIEVPKGFTGCGGQGPSKTTISGEEYFKEDSTYDGDIIVYLYAYDDKGGDTIAAAKACAYHQTFRDPSIAIMGFNLALLFADDKLSELSQIMALETLVHEFFHIFGFNSIHKKYFKEYLAEKGKKYPNLSKLNVEGVEVFDKGTPHWSCDFLTNDIMSPVISQDKIISIFTMEFLEIAGVRIRTRKDYLKNNFLLENVPDFNKYLNYKCNDNDAVSEYKHFCSKKESDKNDMICDENYIYRLQCSEFPNANNCYKKIAHSKYTCIDEANSKSDYALPFETYGDDSRCFVVNGQSQCLATSVRDNKVFVKFPSGEKECTQSNEKIRFEYVNPNAPRSKRIGTLTCPDLDKFKKSFRRTYCQKNCHGNGNCIDGICYCFKGYNPETHCKTEIGDQKETIFYPLPIKNE